MTAAQAGNGNYSAAAPVSRTFAIALAGYTVPNVVGKTTAAARAAAAKAHCRAAKIAFAVST